MRRLPHFNLNVNYKVAVFGFSLLLMGMGVSTSLGQITTNTALQIAEGQTVIRLQGRLLQLQRPGQDLRIRSVPIVAAHGLSPDFTLFGLIPYQFRSFENSDLPFKESSSGIGDLRIFARYYLYAKNKTGQMVRFAGLGGLEFPTGPTEIEKGGTVLPQPLQPGGGSWNPFGGLVFTRHTLAWHLDAAATYTKNTTNQNSGLNRGDELLISVSNTYRLIPWKMKMVKGFVFGLIEQNVRWNGKSEIRNITQPNSGSVAWSILPGLQYIQKKLTIEAGIDLPIVDTANNNQFERKRMVIVSTRINF